jgi:hypothetical protein
LNASVFAPGVKNNVTSLHVINKKKTVGIFLLFQVQQVYKGLKKKNATPE